MLSIPTQEINTSIIDLFIEDFYHYYNNHKKLNNLNKSYQEILQAYLNDRGQKTVAEIRTLHQLNNDEFINIEKLRLFDLFPNSNNASFAHAKNLARFLDYSTEIVYRDQNQLFLPEKDIVKHFNSFLFWFENHSSKVAWFMLLSFIALTVLSIVLFAVLQAPIVLAILCIAALAMLVLQLAILPQEYSRRNPEQDSGLNLSLGVILCMVPPLAICIVLFYTFICIDDNPSAVIRLAGTVSAIWSIIALTLALLTLTTAVVTATPATLCFLLGLALFAGTVALVCKFIANHSQVVINYTVKDTVSDEMKAQGFFQSTTQPKFSESEMADFGFVNSKTPLSSQ